MQCSSVLNVKNRILRGYKTKTKSANGNCNQNPARVMHCIHIKKWKVDIEQFHQIPVA